MNKVNFGLSLIDLHLFQKTRERYYLQYLLYSEIISVCVCKLQKRLSYVFPMSYVFVRQKHSIDFGH